MNLFYEGTEIVRIKRDQLEWLMALPRDGILPFEGAAPALLQWKTTPPTGKLAPSGCSLKHLTIFHPILSPAALEPWASVASIICSKA